MKFSDSFLHLEEKGLNNSQIDIENLFAVAYYKSLGDSANTNMHKLIVMLGYELSKEFDITDISLVDYSFNYNGYATVKVNNCYFSFKFNVSVDSDGFHNFNSLKEFFPKAA